MVRAPFQVHAVNTGGGTQAVGISLYLAPLCIDRFRIYGKYGWVYKFQYARMTLVRQYLGAFLLSLPSHEMVWRRS